MDSKTIAQHTAERTERLALVRAVSTDVLRLVPDVVSALETVGVDPVVFFEKALERAHARANNGH